MLEERVEPKGDSEEIMFTLLVMNEIVFVRAGKELAAFGGVVKQMLEDTQHRLVFRAQVSTNS